MPPLLLCLSPAPRQMSSLLQYPFTLQFLRSMVPYEAWRHPDLLRLSHITTWIWVLAYAASALLYIVSRHQRESCKIAAPSAFFHTPVALQRLRTCFDQPVKPS